MTAVLLAWPDGAARGGLWKSYNPAETHNPRFI